MTEHDSAPHNSEITAALTRTSRPRWARRLIAASLILAAGAIIILFLRPDDDSKTGVSYQTEPAKRGDLMVIVTATGNLAPVNQVEVGSELSGIVRSVEADFNDHVSAGQPLARLDTSKLEAQVLQARASLEVARARVLQNKATVDETTRQLKRLKSVMEMSGGKAVSQQDLGAAEASLERALADQASAEATVSQALAALKAIETDLSKATIHSPINGVVLSRSVDPGQTVAASLQAPVLFSLAEDLTKMELHVDVDEADVGMVSPGQQATFTVDAYPDRSFPAQISQVRYAAKTVDGVVTYETLLLVDNSDLSLRPGMTATADIVVQEVRDVLLVPNAALRFSPPKQITSENSGGRNSGNISILSRLFPRPRHSTREQKKATPTRNGAKSQKVWILKNGIPNRVQVTTGSTDGSHTEITGGQLKDGDELVTDSTTAKS